MIPRRLVLQGAGLLASVFVVACGSSDRVAGGASSETENAVGARLFLIHPSEALADDTLRFRYRVQTDTTEAVLAGRKEYQVRTPAGARDFAMRRDSDTSWAEFPSLESARDSVVDLRIATDSTSGRILLDLRLFADCPAGRACGRIRDTRDGRTYSWVDLAGTRWLRQNAAFGVGRPGVFAGTGDHAPFDDRGEILHGLHYTWDAAVGLACPEGWRLASRADWNDLEAVITRHEARQVRAVGAWGGAFPGTDATGLGIRPSGARNPDGTWIGGGSGGQAYFWTSEALTDSTAMDRWFVGSDSLFHDDVRSKSRAHSVRCTSS